MRCLPILLLAALFATANAQQLPPQLTSDELGYVAGINYHNNVLGLKIQRPPGWEMFTAGQMNVGDAVTGRWSEVPAAVVARHARVLGMTDSTTAVSIMAMIKMTPADEKLTIDDMATLIKASMLQHLSSSVAKPEAVAFTDPTHNFSGFRILIKRGDEQAVIAGHFTVLSGYLVQLYVVADTPEHLTAAEKLVKAGIQFVPPKP